MQFAETRSLLLVYKMCIETSKKDKDNYFETRLLQKNKFRLKCIFFVHIVKPNSYIYITVK